MTTDKDTMEPKSLRIRFDGGREYSASSLDELKQWARDGRISPSTELSVDDGPWAPVSGCRELEMDWVAEVSAGMLYGPVHRSAIEALKADGSIPADAPLFRRKTDQDSGQSERERARELAYETRIEALEKELAAAEQSLRAARAESVEAKGSAAARDMEAGAERQEHQAAIARLNAEIAKRDARIAALELKCKEVEAAIEKNSALSAAAERRAAKAEESRAALEESERAAREDARDARASLASARADAARMRKAADDAKAELRASRLRAESIRKLLLQAVSVSGEGAARAAGNDAVEVVVGADGVAMPPVVDAAPATGLSGNGQGRNG